jgi:hypothetical protein
MTARSYGDALATVTEAMIHVHEQTCEVPGQHAWNRCTSSPTLYATADGLDVLEAGAELSVVVVPAVALAMHNRECVSPGCAWPDLTEVEAHAASWDEQARALLTFASARRDTPPPPVAGVRGQLLVVCECGCIRRNHSVDGQRCYRCGVLCQDAGGFRPKAGS